MDSNSSNDDEEPKVCTVFSSSASTNEPKTVFDTIAFTVPKKDSPTKEQASVSEAFSAFLMPTSPKSQQQLATTPTTGMSKTTSMMSVLADDLQSDKSGEASSGVAGAGDAGKLFQAPKEKETKSQQPEPDAEVDSELPTAKSLFSDAPEVPFPVNVASAAPLPVPVTSGAMLTAGDQIHTQAPQMQHIPPVSMGVNPPPIFPSLNTSSHVPVASSYDSHNPTYDIWIPSKDAKAILSAITSQPSGTYIPDKSSMTMPGIMHDEEFMDKVGVNVARIFGDAEATKRKILSADNVKQDENGLRELIKLGCYRSALNLTKRLLTLCGQGPGKAGHYSKHTAYSLQVWFTRISLLVRVREFVIAESEVSFFNDFENPDMYYEYYPDLSSQRKGSLVPFHFRLLAAEIPQYLRKSNETMEKLTKLLLTVNSILKNLEGGLHEGGSLGEAADVNTAIKIWKERRIYVLYSLANSSLFAKQYHNAFLFLTRLCEIDPGHRPQLKAAIGRLFLQHGDLTSAQEYFHKASELRTLESDSDQVDTLVDSALILITQNSYPEALALLTQASHIQPDNFMVLNNMAVCLLYLGKVKESVALMETTVRQNIPQSLQENVLLNLSSVIELENSDGSKKNALLKLISEYKGDGVNLASLKLPNLI